jgi:hypothetical protein
MPEEQSTSPSEGRGAALKPCPFCGSENLEVLLGNVMCACVGYVPSVDKGDPPIPIGARNLQVLWNKRPIEDAKDAEIAKLREDYQLIRNCVRSCEDCDPDNRIMEGIRRRAKIEVLKELLGYAEWSRDIADNVVKTYFLDRELKKLEEENGRPRN